MHVLATAPAQAMAQVKALPPGMPAVPPAHSVLPGKISPPKQDVSLPVNINQLSPAHDPPPLHITVPDDDTTQDQTSREFTQESPPTSPKVYTNLECVHDGGNDPLWIDSYDLANQPRRDPKLNTSLDGLLPGGIRFSSTPTTPHRSGKEQSTMEKLEQNQQVIINYLKCLSNSKMF